MFRGALDLLSVYDDDEESEDDIVPGAKVSTKRTHKSDSEDEDKNIKSKLPIPMQFTKQNTEIIHETQHNGRIRSFPHERGNWATFVYIPFSSNYGLDELLESLTTKITSIGMNKIDDFHISLTKTVVLKYHWIKSFIATISEKIKGCQRFIIMFDSLQIYCNEEQTRTFIGLKINTGYNSLVKLTSILDTCLIEYKLDTFYKDPSFHMSILWCLGDKVKELTLYLPEMNAIFNNVCNNTDSTCWYINVDSIQCKTGNKFFTFSI